MRFFKILLIIILSVCTLKYIYGQNQHKLDSLWNAFNHANHDTTRIKTYLNIGAIYLSENPDMAIKYFQKALKTAGENKQIKLADQNHVVSPFGFFKANALRYIGVAYKNQGSYEKAVEYFLKALKIYEELGNKKSMSECYIYLGSVICNQGSYDKSTEYYLKALKVYEELGNKNGMSDCYGNIGIINGQKGDYDKSIECFLKALKIKEKLGDKQGISICFVNIGIVYRNQGSYDKAIECYLKALKIMEELDDKKGLSGCYNNIGIVYYNQERNNKALDYYFKALKIMEELDDKKGLSGCYNNIGKIEYDQGNYDKAIEYYLKSLKIKEELGDKYGKVLVYDNIADIHIKLADSAKFQSESWRNRHIDTAIVCGNKAMDIAKEINSATQVYWAASYLQRAYKAKGNYKKALDFAEIFIQTKDTIFSEEKTKALAEMGAKYDSEKKQLQIENLNKENELKKAELAQSEEKRGKQLILIYSFIAGFIIILVFSIVIYRLFRLKKKANILLSNQKQQIEIQNASLNQANEEISAQRDEIEAQRNEIAKHRDLVVYQKEEIEASINYAKRIQSAVLPTEEHLQMFLGEYFILFCPKDIVSGDFYWATLIKNWQIVTVADCTGHGVPGAFMSMLGVSFLNEIVRKQEVTKASEVLNHLRKSVIESLKQTGKSGSQKDGMDMSLAVINIETNILEFAGANNPLWIVKKPKVESYKVDAMEEKLDKLFTFELEELKGDKMPIAIYDNMDDFTNHELQLNSGDILYLMSDGYEDQFGGPKGKKFLSKNLKKLLLDYSQKTMNEQKDILEKTLIGWIGEGEQIDDITILGIKI